MNKTGLGKLIGWVLILTLLFPHIVAASSQGTGPELEIMSAQAYSGQSAVVNVVIHRPQGLKTFEFTLRYDRNVLALTDQDIAKGTDVENWLFEYKVDHEEGVVRIAAAQLEGFRSNAQAAVARLTFKASGSAGAKPFSVTDVKGFMDVNTQADLSSRAGSFTIMDISQPEPESTPEPTPESTPAPTTTPDPSDELDNESEASGLTASAIVDQRESEDVSVQLEGEDFVTIMVDAPMSSRIIKVGLDKSSVSQIIKEGRSVNVQTPLGVIALNAETVAQFAGSEIVIEIGQVVQAVRATQAAQAAGNKPARTIKLLADGREVSRFDGKVTVTIPYSPEASESANSIVVYRLSDSDNRAVIVPQSRAASGQVMFVAQGSATFIVGYNEKEFADASEHWSNANIGFVAARGLFLGISDNEFAPDRSMTRGMLVTVLGRMLGIEEGVETAGFSDVSEEAYYASYIAYASKNGIVNGIGNGKFAPDREVTREEMAKMLIGFMQHAQILVSELNGNAAFEDEAAISDWAASAIERLQAAGILEGKPGNVFDPKGFVTRAEAAKVVRYLIEAYVGLAVQ